MSELQPAGKLGPTPGSPHSGEPGFLVVGKLRRPHGLRGELLMDVITDFPERLNVGDNVYVGEEHLVHTIRTLRWHGNNLLVSFERYHNPESAGILRNHFVYVREDDRPTLAEGEYYHHQLLGMRVFDEHGTFLGSITEILVTGANDVYVIRPESGPEILLPAIEPVILNIDPEKGEMRVHVLPGILPD